MAEYRAPVTNARVAKDLGITHSAVSRLRSGNRHPSVALIQAITNLTRWKEDYQIKALTNGDYAEKFEEMLGKHYGETASA